MTNSLLLVAISFAIAIILTPILKQIGIKFKIYDVADGDELKIHKKPIPPLGGLAIMISLFTIIIIYLIKGSAEANQVIAIVVAGLIIGLFGLYDDLKWKHVEQANPKVKVAVQQILIIAVSVLFYFVNISSPIIPIAVVSIFIIFCFINGLINAVNLQDGMDGLAGGIILISSVGFAIVSKGLGIEIVYIMSLGLVGAIFGFLVFNFNPAKIFMGDNGSFFLGLIIAIFAIFTINQPYNFVLLIGVIFVIGLPIFDMAFAILRRIMNSKPIFLGDRSHIYDLIHKHVSSIKKTVVIYYCIQLIFVLGGISIIKFFG